MAIALTTTEPLPGDDRRVTQPIFTVRETARHLAVAESTLSRWAGELVSTVDGGRGSARVPFVGFAEAYVLSSLRKAGVPLQRIRPAVETLRREIGLDHALASRDLYTDGTEVLMRFVEEHEPQLLELTVVRTGQKQLSELVRDDLQRITYGDDGWANRIELPTYGRATVIVDPSQAFGLPLVVDGGARVEDLVDRFVAGDTLADIALDFGVPVEQVEDVVRVATKAATAAA